MPKQTRQTRWKVLSQSYASLLDIGTTQQLRILSNDTIAALLTLSQYLEWTTRYEDTITVEQAETFAARVQDELMSPIDLCQLIADCVNGNGVATQSIIEVTSNGSASGNLIAAQQWNDRPLGTTPETGCGDADTNDIIWGQCSELIDYLEQVNTDALEVFEVYTNRAEIAIEIIGAVASVAYPVASAVLDWVAFIQNSIKENYDAQVTTAYLEALKCDLFCRVIDNDCELTPAILYDVFTDRLSASFGITELIENVLEFLILGSWSGTEIADFMFLSQLAFRSTLGKYVDGVTYIDLDLRWALGQDNPSSDWSLLCDDCNDCGDTELLYDFSVNNGGFATYDVSPSVPGDQLNGQYVAATAWEDTTIYYGDSRQAVDIEKSFTRMMVNSVTIGYDAVEGTGNQTQYPIRVVVLDGSTVVFDSGIGSQRWGVGQQTRIDVGEIGDKVRISSVAMFDSSNDHPGDGDVAFYDVQVCGDAL